MDNDLRVSRCPSPISSYSPKLPPPALNHSLASQLRDAQYRISSFSSAKHQLQQKVQQLEINNNTLSSRCNELTEEYATLRAQLMSLQLERENFQFQAAKKGAKKIRALSTLPTHSQNDDVLIIGNSMVRHLAGELSKTHEVKSTGFVYPGSKCQRLTQMIPQTQSQNQPRKPNVVVMAGGMNNIAAGEFVTNICENVKKMLKTAQDTYPLSKIMFSSIHHRTDLDDCITINKKIDAVNNNVKHLCSLRGYMFMDNNTQDSECDLIMPSPYFNDETLISSLKAKSQNVSIYSLNCQSLNAKIDQIKLKIKYLRENGVEFNAIRLQKTWLSDDSDTSLLQINGYQLISQGKTLHTGVLLSF